jgi:hypothetical protein
MTNVLVVMCNEKIDCRMFNERMLSRLVEKAGTYRVSEMVYKAIKHYLECEYDVEEDR